MAKFELPPYTFGVEIECFGVPPAVVAWTLTQQAKVQAVDLQGNRNLVPQADRVMFDRAAENRYDSHQAWVIGSDCSVRGVHPMEIKSPILKGMAGIKALRRVLRTLTKLGVQVNESTGLHVHVGVKNAEGKYAYNAKTAVELLRQWAKNEKQIESLIHKSRRGGRNGFCRPASARLGDIEARLPSEPEVTCEAPPVGFERWPALDRESFIARGFGQYRWVRDGRYHERPEPVTLETMPLNRIGEYGDHYDGVSLSSLLKYGTIEFRLHHGSIDPQEVTAWVMFVVNQVDRARMVTAGEVNKGRGRKPGIFCGLPLNLRAHFKNKAKKLAEPYLDPRTGLTY